jgi:hypothetical protein
MSKADLFIFLLLAAKESLSILKKKYGFGGQLHKTRQQKECAKKVKYNVPCCLKNRYLKYHGNVEVIYPQYLGTFDISKVFIPHRNVGALCYTLYVPLLSVSTLNIY